MLADVGGWAVPQRSLPCMCYAAAHRILHICLDIHTKGYPWCWSILIWSSCGLKMALHQLYPSLIPASGSAILYHLTTTIALCNSGCWFTWVLEMVWLQLGNETFCSSGRRLWEQACWEPISSTCSYSDRSMWPNLQAVINLVKAVLLMKTQFCKCLC